MNWYTKMAASIVNVSPRFRGKDRGTSGARPMQISDNPKIFGTENNLAAIPDSWDTMESFDKLAFISQEVEKGRLKFPYAVETFAKVNFEADPHAYLNSLVVCFNKMARFPNFARDWVYRSYRNQQMPVDLRQIINNQLKFLQTNDLDMLFDYNTRSQNRVASNWFKRLKIAMPLAQTVCPSCLSAILVDVKQPTDAAGSKFYDNKEVGECVTRCAKCSKFVLVRYNCDLNQGLIGQGDGVIISDEDVMNKLQEGMLLVTSTLD
jgi:hypothetical protein